jgi:hypothetical protein
MVLLNPQYEDALIGTSAELDVRARIGSFVKPFVNTDVMDLNARS